MMMRRFSFGSRRRGTAETPVAAALSGTAYIVGTGAVGDVHSVSGYVLSGSPQPTLSFSWKVGGVQVATTATYTPVIADATGGAGGFSSGFSAGFGGAPRLTCTVSATNASGSATPLETAAIDIGSPLKIISATLDKTSAWTGSTFTVGYTGATTADDVTYQWYLNDAVASGETDDTYTVDDAGTVFCRVTATEGTTEVYLDSDPATVFHQEFAGAVADTADTNAAGTFASASAEIHEQAFIILVAYEGPVPTTTTIGGVTLTSFTEGASQLTSGKTLTCQNVAVSGSNRVYVFSLEGLTGAHSVAFSYTTGTNFTYLKAHCYQVSQYDLDNMVLTQAVGTGTNLSVAIYKTYFGLAIGMANRMSFIPSPPTGWDTKTVTDQPTSGLDAISGYILDEDAYFGTFDFYQPQATSGEQAISLAVPTGEILYPELYADPTITGTPVQGTAITLNIAAASAVTEIVQVRVYWNDATRVQVGATIEYEVGSGDPAPEYVPTVADLGKTLVVGEIPVAGLQAGPERFSAPTAAVTAAGTTTTYLTKANFTFEGTSVANGGTVLVNGVYVQRADMTIAAGQTVPGGYEIAVLRSTTPDIIANSGHPELQNVRTLTELGIGPYVGSVILWRSGGGAPNGVTQFGYVYLKETATGTLYDAFSDHSYLSFVSVVTGGIEYPPAPGFGAADQTLSAATQTAITAALNARILTGSGATWTIDLPSGYYGALSLNGFNLPGPTILRSQNLALGAKFGWINVQNCNNIYFQLVDADKTLSGYTTYNVGFMTSTNCGIAYSRIYCGEATPTPSVPWGPLGYHYNIRFNVATDNPGGGTCQNIRIHQNLIQGCCEKQIYSNASFNGEISDNVFVRSGGDDIYSSWGEGNLFLRNWGARLRYSSSENGRVGDPYDHGDFYQLDMRGASATGYQLIGNVFMVGNETGYVQAAFPHQGIFGSGATTTAANFIYNNNIVMNNSVHGVTVTGVSMTNMSATYNSAIWCVDAPQPGPQYTSTISIQGGNSGIVHHNVQSNFAGNTSAGPDSLNMVQGNNAHTSQLAYYTSPRLASSFYDLRPIPGQVTYWGYSGGPAIGGAARFRDVIIGGQYPKIGPAATAWKTWYDPTNQITS